MKNISYLILMAFVTTLDAQVTFNGRTVETYTYLTGASEIQPSNTWGLNENLPLKLSYPIVLDGNSYDSSFINGGNLIFRKNGKNEAIIWGTFLSVSDRSLYDKKFKSRILYKVDGIAPNRIQKFEFRAFGFNDEFEEDLTFTDSGSIQIWVHETGNKVEVKYGPSKTTKTFTFSANRNIVGFSFLKRKPYAFPFLTGNVNNPTLVNDTLSKAELSAYPSSGSVYTFTLNNTSNIDPSLEETVGINYYPNPSTGSVNVNNPLEQLLIVDLFDPSGKKVKSFDLEPHSNTVIDLNSIPKGLYYMYCYGNQVNKKFQVILQ